MANALFTKGCPTSPPPQPDNSVTAMQSICCPQFTQKQQQFHGDIYGVLHVQKTVAHVGWRVDPAVRVMGVEGGGAAGYLRRHLQKDTFTF